MTTAHAAAPDAELHGQPVALQGDVLRRRIYAPLAYAPVRNAALVPIVHSECAGLASWYPLVWRRGPSGHDFVAVRALMNDQRAQPMAARAVLPLVLHAYPFMLAPDQAGRDDARKMIDDVFADAPTDVGASITTVHRKLGRATAGRLQILDRIAQEASLTDAVGQALDEIGCLDPWPLRFEVNGRHVELANLLVINPAAFEDGRLAPLLAKFGWPCAQMLGLHRVSLFRAGALLAALKGFLGEQRTSGDPVAALDAETEPAAP